MVLWNTFAGLQYLPAPTTAVMAWNMPQDCFSLIFHKALFKRRRRLSNSPVKYVGTSGCVSRATLARISGLQGLSMLPDFNSADLIILAD
jgi:hypothetical protein